MSVFFTIIVPTHNSSKTLRSTIESVLRQTIKSFELIIIDSLSADATTNIIAECASKDERIKWVSEKDEGIYDAMNKGIKMAKGEWLYFLGSDDSLYADEVLAKVKKAISSNPASKLIFGDVFTSASYVQKYSGYNFLKLTEMNICHQAIFYHRSLFFKHQYQLKYTVFSDWDFNLKVFKKKNKPLYIKEIISLYNLTGTSGNWYSHPEYLAHFSDKKELILRYGGPFILGYYFFHQIGKRLIAKLSRI